MYGACTCVCTHMYDSGACTAALLCNGNMIASTWTAMLIDRSITQFSVVTCAALLFQDRRDAAVVVVVVVAVLRRVCVCVCVAMML